MKELVILSGKGGTGKTTLTAAFASLAGGCLLCDADVDAADLHLLMQPDILQQTDFMGGGDRLHRSATLHPMRHLHRDVPVVGHRTGFRG